MKRLTTSRADTTESDWSLPPDSAVFEHLKRRLAEAFAAPDAAYVEMTAETIIARNRNR